MSTIEAFELAHKDELLVASRQTLPRASWRTPDGTLWAPQAVLRGWTSRLSDSWAWLRLHAWIAAGDVSVTHIDLPCALRMHSSADPAWRFVAMLGDEPAERLPLATFGAADLAIPYDDGKPAMLVELGTCAPVKFVLNLGTTERVPHMIVPYGIPYGFVFVADRLLLPTDE